MIIQTPTDHFGGWSIWDEAPEVYAEIPNFYVDCSSSFPWISKETALKIIRKYGANKVLFGTDYPMWSPKSELEYFLSLPLEKNEISSILNINAKKLFNLEAIK